MPARGSGFQVPGSGFWFWFWVPDQGLRNPEPEPGTLELRNLEPGTLELWNPDGALTP
jgi:hypothetical protein